MDDLIKRLENAEEGSRELDAEIFDLRPGNRTQWANDPLNELPYYTTSLDAAVSLIPEGWEYEISKGYAAVAPEPWSEQNGLYLTDVGGADANGKTPELAVCIAALLARAGGV